MIRRRFRAIIAIGIIVGVGLYITSLWQDMQTKSAIQENVQQGLTVGLHDFITNAPREHLLNQYQSYYLPDTSNSRSPIFTVYKDTLEVVNEDWSSPLCKITGVQVTSGGSLDVITADATVRYRGFFGIMHTIYVHQDVKSLS